MDCVFAFASATKISARSARGACPFALSHNDHVLKLLRTVRELCMGSSIFLVFRLVERRFANCVYDVSKALVHRYSNMWLSAYVFVFSLRLHQKLARGAREELVL